MSLQKTNLARGDYSIFGFTRDPYFIEQRLKKQLGINPKTFQIGAQGQMFFYSTYGDVAESQEGLVLKLGFLRSKTKSALNAQQLLEQKIVAPGSIDTDKFSGNGLVVGLSKTEPVFSAFQTLMGVPQLYYYEWDDGILCSDVLRIMTRLIPKREINEAVLPQHFLFRSVYGSHTYFQGVERIIQGQYIRWLEGKIEKRRVRSLDVVATEAEYIRDDDKALNLLYRVPSGRGWRLCQPDRNKKAGIGDIAIWRGQFNPGAVSGQWSYNSETVALDQLCNSSPIV